MALATTARFIDFHDARLPPRIETVEDSEQDFSSIQMHSLQDQDQTVIEDENQSLFVPLAPAKLTRSGSLGNSWGVTAVGRGFGGKWKGKEEEAVSDNVLSKDAVPDLDNDDTNNRATQQVNNERPTAQSLPNESPITPPSDSPSPSFPELKLVTSPTRIDRPVLPARAQSMYIVTNSKPALSVPTEALGDQIDDETREQIRLGRQRAWSRPLNSPMRSPSVPLLAPSTSAPHLAARHTLTPLTPFVDPLSGSPTTPRSPRLTRARNSQKRISLVAGRQVAGLSLLGMENDADGSPEDWIMFGGSRSGNRTSPPPSAVLRSQSPTSTSSDSASPTSSPVEPSVPYIGRSLGIKSLGRLGSSSSINPPTPLRAVPSGSAVDVSPQSPISIAEAASAIITSGELPVPVEDAPVPPEIEYPSLDVPGPNFSLSRLSSSWSISGPHHHHRPSVSSVKRNQSIGKKSQSPPSSDGHGAPQLDGKTLKRISSDASALSIHGKRRGGGYLGGKTIDDYVVWGELGRGAYGMVNRAKERKKPEVVVLEDGGEVIVDPKPDETVGPPLIIKQIIKSRILADCWKKHPDHGTIPIEIYVMSALSGTSYVLPNRRAWDPRRFEHWAEEDAHNNMMKLHNTSTSSSATVTPHSSTIQVHQTFAEAAKESNTTHGEGCTGCTGGDDLDNLCNPALENWRWIKGNLIKGHPNICPLEDFFEDAMYYYLVLPATKPSLPKIPPERMVGGGGVLIEPGVEGEVPAPKDLFDLVELYPVGLPAALIRSYLGQIADALSFLHARGICHRDIKDENVVLGEHGRCWLIDFGSSGVVRKNGWDSFSGTLDYAAPEILQGARYAGPPQDVWAFGIVAYVLLTGECPFSSAAEAANGLEDPENKAALALRERCSGGPDGFDEGLERDGGGRLGDAMEMLRRCLEVDVTKRPTMEEVLTCRYLVGGDGWGQELPVVSPDA